MRTLDVCLHTRLSKVIHDQYVRHYIIHITSIKVPPTDHNATTKADERTPRGKILTINRNQIIIIASEV